MTANVPRKRLGLMHISGINFNTDDRNNVLRSPMDVIRTVSLKMTMGVKVDWPDGERRLHMQWSVPRPAGRLRPLAFPPSTSLKL